MFPLTRCAAVTFRRWVRLSSIHHGHALPRQHHPDEPHQRERAEISAAILSAGEFRKPADSLAELQLQLHPKSKEPTYAGRIDQRVNDKFTFYGRFLFNDQTVRQEDDGLPTQYPGMFKNDQTSGDYMLAATYVFSPTVVNEARISYARMWGIYQNFLDGKQRRRSIGLTGYPEPITPDAYGVPMCKLPGC